jgi:hypothetical protein
VEIALADIKWNPSPPNDRPIEEKVRDINYIFRLKQDDFSTYWLGHAEANDYTPRPTSTDWARIEGEYKAAQRKRSISQKIQIAGNLTVKHQ